MCDQNQSTISVRKRHSFCTTSFSQGSNTRSVCKSDANINYIHSTEMFKDESLTTPNGICVKHTGCYKNYDLDEVPVKDDSSFNDHSFSEDNDLRNGDNKDSITNSDLDKLEMKILRKMSQELQTDDTTVSSLDSNIKLFKTTVQQIFNNFYNNMQDFELYKKKFNEILEKNKGSSFSEMEDFVKDMIQNIVSSDSSMSNKKIAAKSSMEDNTKERNKECSINVDTNTMAKVTNSANSTVETYLNNNYLTDSTFDNNSSQCNPCVKREETFNIYLLTSTPCVQIKMSNRDMLSEINIRNQNIDKIDNQLASAENIKKLAAKKIQLQNYAKQQQEYPLKDRNIPVRISNAKKNIHLDEDFASDDKEDSQFFIFKICDYICRKIRKNSFG